jgi:hypothetical protein
MTQIKKRFVLKSLISFSNIGAEPNTVQVNLVQWFINYLTETVILDSIRNSVFSTGFPLSRE